MDAAQRALSDQIDTARSACSTRPASWQQRPACESRQAREAAFEHAVGLTAKDLAGDVAASAMALRTIARQLPGDAWRYPVRIPGSAPFPAAQLLTRRLVEVELHHCDLGEGGGPAGRPAAFAAMELPEPMRSQRQERVQRAG